MRCRLPVAVAVLLATVLSSALPAALGAAEGRLLFRFYCLDVQEGMLDRLGRERGTGQLPDRLPLASALALLDQDRVRMVAFARVEAVPGKEAAASNTKKAIYLDPAPGGFVQRQSEWDEGVSVRITPVVDADGRIRIDGEYALKSINSRAPLVGVEKLELGRPLTHSTQTLNPAVVLRPGEARLLSTLSSGDPAKERVLMITVEKAE